MDWVMVILIVVEGANFTQSHSHAHVNYTSEKLCAEARSTLQSDLAKPTENGAKVTVRASCLLRKG